MSFASADLGAVRQIVVAQALGLSELLCAVPFFRAVRSRFPAARITLIGQASAADLVRRLDAYVDAFEAFPGWPGIGATPYSTKRTSAYLAAARADRADLAIQLHGNGRAMNGFVAALGARWTAGFCPPTPRPVLVASAGAGVAIAPAPVAAGWADLDIAVPYPARIPEVRRHLLLAQVLGADAMAPALEFPLRAADEMHLAAAFDAAGYTGRWRRRRPYAVLHPGASNPARRWSPDRFAAVGDALAIRGYVPVITGVAAEARQCSLLVRGMRAPALDLSGRTSLGALAALIAGASIVVSNDTAVSHLADALARPSVVLFLGSDPDRWAPLDSRRHLSVVAPDLGPGCADSGRPGHPDCDAAGCVVLGAEPAPSRRSIEVGAVVRAIDGLLASADSLPAA